MRKLFKRSLIICLSITSVLATARFCKKATGGFSELSIIHPLQNDIQDLPDELKHLQNQTFTYLGKGAQAFVFISEDKKHVIKFLRFDHLLPKRVVRALSFLPYPYFQNRILKSQREIRELLKSFDYAQKELKAFTSVSHFQMSSLPSPIKFIDRIGVRHLISKAPFIIQDYTIPVEECIDQLSLDQALDLVHQFTLLFKTRHSLNIKDDDPNILTNFGYHDGKLVEFDIGRFYSLSAPSTFEDKQKEARQIMKPFFTRLESKYPSLESYFEELIQDL